MKNVRSQLVKILLVTFLLTSCMSHQEYYKEIGLNEDGIINGQCIFYQNTLDGESKIYKIEHKENVCSLSIKGTKEAITFCFKAKSKLYDNNFNKKRDGNIDIANFRDLYQNLRNNMMAENIEEIKTINSFGINKDIAKAYFKSDDVLNEEIPSYDIDNVADIIKSCDDLFLKNVIEQRAKEEVLQKRKWDEYYQGMQEKNENINKQSVFKHYGQINNKIKQLGFAKVFDYTKICTNYNEDNESFFYHYNLYSPVGFSTIGNIYHAIKNCNLSASKAKNYFIIQGENEFEFINYDNKYAYYLDREADITIAVKRKQSGVYMQNSNLQGRYFKVIGLIEVSRLVIKDSRLQVLAFEEVELSVKNRQFIDKEIEEIVKIGNQ